MITCITGDSIGESFSMRESDVGLTMLNSGSDVAKNIGDLILGGDFRILLDTMKLGRNIFENVRKFIQFQVIVSINLILYITIGALLYTDWPI